MPNCDPFWHVRRSAAHDNDYPVDAASRLATIQSVVACLSGFAVHDGPFRLPHVLHGHMVIVVDLGMNRIFYFFFFFFT